MLGPLGPTMVGWWVSEANTSNSKLSSAGGNTKKSSQVDEQILLIFALINGSMAIGAALLYWVISSDNRVRNAAGSLDTRPAYDLGYFFGKRLGAALWMKSGRVSAAQILLSDRAEEESP